MSDDEQGQQQDPVESGAVENLDGAGEAGGSADERLESGNLQESQQAKGYGEDEGEREQALRSQ